jgi:hypothetical protein
LDEWQKLFEVLIGMPFPMEMVPGITLAPIFQGEHALALVGSPAAIENPYVTDPREFIQKAPDGYLMIGFWGYGVNSYAFYYVAADAWRKVYLRLPYGGAYMDNEEMARLIRQFLPSYLALEKRLFGKAKSLVMVETMGGGSCSVVFEDGRSVEHHGSMLFEPFSPDHLGL